MAVRQRRDVGVLEHSQQRAAAKETRGHQAKHHIQEVRGDEAEAHDAQQQLLHCEAAPAGCSNAALDAVQLRSKHAPRQSAADRLSIAAQPAAALIRRACGICGRHRLQQGPRGNISGGGATQDL